MEWESRELSVRRIEKGMADKTWVKHARRVQRSLCFVKCGAATEPCKLVS